VNSDLLLIFTRYPEPGKVKTRLISALGPAGACNLHQRLTSHILQIAKNFAATATQRDFLVCFDGASIRQMQQMFGLEYDFVPQSEGDLGSRMSAAFAQFLAQGRRRVVLIGSDCPGITGEILDAAFYHLHNHNLVLGPATDGGYYLIGLSAHFPELFQDLPWGTAEILTMTMKRAASLGLRTRLLETLTDIDRPGDLEVWDKFNRLSCDG
jgi:rSAM/selenodomain-associated transferase 1